MESVDNQILTLIMGQLSDMKREISEQRRENVEFRREILQELKNFKTETSTRFDRLEGQIAVMRNDITGLQHDVSNLFTWDYWTLSIILVLVIMPYVANGVKAFFGAVAEGISAVIGAFRRDSK